MRGKLTALFLMAVFAHVLADDEIDSAFVARLGLPVLSIHTIDNEMPQCDYVWAPEGEFGISITNKTKVPGRVIVSTSKGDILYDSYDYQKDERGMTLRIRGNTSAYYSRKKPYKIKLEKKGDLLGRGDDRFSDKNWLLIDEGGDNLNAIIGMKLNSIMNLGKWTPAYMVVNLIINDEYHGIYTLVESVKRNTKCRINVDKSGFLFERDAYWWNEDVYFSTPSDMEYTFKYPDADEITSEQTDYISNVMATVESSIDEGNYDEFIDVRTFAAWLLAQDILGTGDAAGTNIYLTKNDSTTLSKVRMSTLWDFNAIFKTPSQWASIHNSSFFYFPQLLNSENKLFTAAYKYLWEEMKDSIFNEMDSFIRDFKTSPLAANIQLSRIYDGKRWKYPPDPILHNIENALQWFEERKEWLDNEIGSLQAPSYTDAIHQQPKALAEPSAVYNLHGQKVRKGSAKPSIYIMNGRKVVMK